MGPDPLFPPSGSAHLKIIFKIYPLLLLFILPNDCDYMHKYGFRVVGFQSIGLRWLVNCYDYIY